MTAVSGPLAAVMADLDVRLGGTGWLGRLGIDVFESRELLPGTALLLADRAQLLVSDMPAFREAMDWYELDVDVRRTFNAALRRLADRFGVGYQPIAHRRPRA